MKQRAKLYTQGLNQCVPINILNILRTKYGIILNQEERDKLVSDGETIGIWSRENGAIFRFYYNWFTLRFYENYGLELEVETFDILSDDFEVKAMQGESFGLGLLYAGDWYRKVREDQEITLQEIHDTNKEDYKYYGHHLMWKLNYLIGILRSIEYDKKFIKFKLDAVREAVNKGFLWQTARTLTIKDKLINYYAIENNKGTRFEKVELLDDRNRKALDSALKLRIMKK